MPAVGSGPAGHRVGGHQVADLAEDAVDGRLVVVARGLHSLVDPGGEGGHLLGLQAAAWRVPFLPSRVGLGSDLLKLNDRLRTVDSPYDDGETFVVNASPEYELVSQNSLGEAAFASPAVSRGQVFIRTTGHLWCIGQSPPAQASGAAGP